MRYLWLPAVLALCGVNSRAQDLTGDFSQPSVIAPLPSTGDAFARLPVKAVLNPVNKAAWGDASGPFEALRAPVLDPGILAFSGHGASNAAFAPMPEAPPAAPEPKFVFGARDDYRWQLGLGVSLVRFRSSQYYATGVGTNTSLGYFTNEWLAVQGEVTTSFAPTIFLNEHVKFVSYGVGPLVAWRRRKIEPWMHALFGGVHILPQVANHGQNAFATQIGTGVDYRFYPHLSARVELDWVRSHLFGEWQDSVQTALDLVLHF